MDAADDVGLPGDPSVSYAGFQDPDGNTWMLQNLPH
jgi:hypothetical protein